HRAASQSAGTGRFPTSSTIHAKGRSIRVEEAVWADGGSGADSGRRRLHRRDEGQGQGQEGQGHREGQGQDRRRQGQGQDRRRQGQGQDRRRQGQGQDRRRQGQG